MVRHAEIRIGRRKFPDSCYTQDAMSRRSLPFILLCAWIILCPWACRAADLVFLGDCRQAPGNENHALAGQIITDAIQYAKNVSPSSDLQGVLVAGDFVSDGKDPAGWDSFRAAYAPAFAYPMYPCIGNHDTESSFLQYRAWSYYDIFKKPRWYSADIGGMHLVSLDSNLSWSANPVELVLELLQFHWLRHDLRRSAGKFTIVMWHAPAYTSHPGGGKGHGPDLFMRLRYVPVCEKLGARLVLCGHNHWYERTLPIQNGILSESGIPHITSGGGGANLYPVAAEPDRLRDRRGNVLSAANASAYHYCIISENAQSVSVKAVAYQTHEVLDFFELRK